MRWIFEMMEKLVPYALLIGRVLMSIIFIKSGYGKLTGFDGTAAFMQSKGMVAVPFFLTMTIFVELGGGISLLLGFCPRYAALALALFLIPVTYIFHPFWALEAPERMMQTINFMKNIAIIGGLLAFFAAGSGALSIYSPVMRKNIDG